jgi:Fe-S-cluster-containing hydrogenase component 2/bacterioferritin-associated ferredoxin
VSIKSQSLKIPSHWYDEKEILASKPGAIKNEHHPQKRSGVYPVFHCTQLIPCDPCAYLCPLNLIHIDNHDIRNLPFFRESTRGCSSCLNCVAGCPGLAITLVDYRTDSGYAIVSLPFELNHNLVNMGDDIILSDSQSESLGKAKIFSIIDKKAFNSTKVLQVKVPKEIAELVAGYSIQEPSPFIVNNTAYHNFSDDAIICRCERVTAGEIRDLIHKGYRDLNEIKTITRAGMGACGGKTCQPLISQLFIQEGIPPGDIIPQTNRPLFIEVPLIKFAGTHTHYKK